MNISVSNAFFNPFSGISGIFCSDQKNVTEPFLMNMTRKDSIEKADEISDGEVLGIGFLQDSRSGISYGMAARYADGSTKDHPVIQVMVRKPNKEEDYYNVDLANVNPANATELEMFALCNYLDDINQGTGGTFGSWQDLKCIDINACSNGYAFNTALLENFASAKKDWMSICKMMMDEYLGAGILKQYKDCAKLYSQFSKFA